MSEPLDPAEFLEGDLLPADLPEPLELEVAPAQAGLTVLELISDSFPAAPTAALKRLVQAGDVRLGGEEGPPAGLRRTLASGERLWLDPATLDEVEPEPLPGLEILLDEAEVLGCYKPAGVMVEAGRGESERPFTAGLLHYLGERRQRPRLAHRLDKDTSGLLLVACTRQALRQLTAQFEARTVHKTYLALVSGAPRDESGEIDTPLPGPDGKPQDAFTRWRVAERFRRHTWLEVEIQSGRQHQIRRHLAQVGHPVVCDARHGDGQLLLLSELKRGGYRGKGQERPLLARQGLHAWRLAFDLAGRRRQLEAPLPKDLTVALKQLRKHGV